ncbi:hypothetical protein PI124_g15144 [Phytophthora idaei]|nr:hypothetical protein PI125_g14807 [Phytophthora idaei]KAG3145003.1 hypothetical protein PI126_g13920 [Phytophthora idaei]KAG3239945.1 hypothetical protein PI124_g15144 [Phytophthora idaei]
MVASETFRVSGLKIDVVQCKSSKHLHKLYTAFRVAQYETGNTTEKPLKEPLCYATMGDV